MGRGPCQLSPGHNRSGYTATQLHRLPLHIWLEWHLGARQSLIGAVLASKNCFFLTPHPKIGGGARDSVGAWGWGLSCGALYLGPPRYIVGGMGVFDMR